MRERSYFKLLITLFCALIVIDEEFLPIGQAPLHRFKKRWSRILKKNVQGFTLNNLMLDVLTFLGEEVLSQTEAEHLINTRLRHAFLIITDSKSVEAMDDNFKIATLSDLRDRFAGKIHKVRYTLPLTVQNQADYSQVHTGAVSSNHETTPIGPMKIEHRIAPKPDIFLINREIKLDNLTQFKKVDIEQQLIYLDGLEIGFDQSMQFILGLY